MGIRMGGGSEHREMWDAIQSPKACTENVFHQGMWLSGLCSIVVCHHHSFVLFCCVGAMQCKIEP